MTTPSWPDDPPIVAPSFPRRVLVAIALVPLAFMCCWTLLLVAAEYNDPEIGTGAAIAGIPIGVALLAIPIALIALAVVAAHRVRSTRVASFAVLVLSFAGIAIWAFSPAIVRLVLDVGAS